eukprot:6214181-Pleurochrysis_carterae.AAC.1
MQACNLLCLVRYGICSQADDAVRTAVEILNVSERMENPCVNPITCPNYRSAAQVAADLRDHQEETRALAARTPGMEPAIYQGDYLLIRLGIDAAAPITLHRIVHGVFMQSATRHTSTFTTMEYEVTQVGDSTGLWGRWTAKLNPSYNPNNPRSGTKNVRHAAIGRSSVVMYQVQTFDYDGKAKDRGICVESLQALAAKCSEYPLPSPLPVSHTSQAGASAAPHGTAGGRGRGGGGASSGAGGSQGQRGRGQGRGRGRKRRRQEPDSREESDSSDEEEDEDSPEEGESEGEASEPEDPPPPVPNGKQACPWDGDPTSFGEFMLWACVGTASAAWHVGRVERALQAGRRDGFTHDARLDGTRVTRGVTLTEQGHTDGLWTPIEDC